MEYFGPEVSSYRYRIGLDRPYYCEHTIGVCVCSFYPNTKEVLNQNIGMDIPLIYLYRVTIFDKLFCSSLLRIPDIMLAFLTAVSALCL